MNKYKKGFSSPKDCMDTALYKNLPLHLLSLYTQISKAKYIQCL